MVLSSLISTFFLFNALDLTIEDQGIKILNKREIANHVYVDLNFEPSRSAFLTCVPRESIAFPDQLPHHLADQIFRDSELHDLMKCNSERCLFNFLPEEQQQLGDEKTVEGTKKLYFQFYKDRTTGKNGKGVMPSHRAFHIEEASVIPICQGEPLSKLLKNRPVKNIPFRFSHVQYRSSMRPITRLLQGYDFDIHQTNETCYAEALLFADHFDVEHVQVWSLSPDNENKKRRLQLVIRHRLDFLGNWVKRLAKGIIKEELKKEVRSQLIDAARCMAKKHSSRSAIMRNKNEMQSMQSDSFESRKIVLYNQ